MTDKQRNYQRYGSVKCRHDGYVLFNLHRSCEEVRLQSNVRKEVAITPSLF